ncbi:MAG: Stp1/IreP family PP2C-type Ser/Thr phosphatase [Christensenellales bacterium]
MLFASVSHKGYVRENNEDTVYAPASNTSEPMVIVADGIGGHNAGEIASREAVNTVIEHLSQKNARLLPPLKRLEAAIKAANFHVYAKSRKKQFYGMGTTLTMAIMQEDQYFIAHIGDSRAYKISRTEISLLTQDHTLVSELVRSGGITQKEALTHPQRNIITRSLGTEIIAEADFLCGPFLKKEALLLCSDGLTQHVSHEEMHAAFNNCEEDNDYHKMLDHLLSLALSRGGSDNISMALSVNI